MKARKLKSGAWNVRVMINGAVYSFTDSDRKTVMRQASRPAWGGWIEIFDYRSVPYGLRVGVDGNVDELPLPDEKPSRPSA